MEVNIEALRLEGLRFRELGLRLSQLAKMTYGEKGGQVNPLAGVSAAYLECGLAISRYLGEPGPLPSATREAHQTPPQQPA